MTPLTCLSGLRPAVLAAAALLALLAGLALPAVARAHANIDRAEPAPDSTVATAPSTVRIWFTEPVAANASGIQVLDTAGRRVDAGDSRVDLGNPSLLVVSLGVVPPGTYTVAWRNTSTVDGHPLRGTFAFNVGVSTQPVPASSSAGATSEVSPFDPLARWAVLGGLLVALGAEWFALVVLAPALASREARDVSLVLDRRIVGGALAAFTLGAAAQLLLQLQGADGLIGVVTGTRWGQMWLLRGLLVAVAGLVWLRVPRRRRANLAAIALLAAAASTLSFASHAAATRDLEVTAVANDIVHTLASALWAGGLVALLAVVRASRALPADRRAALLRTITRRFSPHALIVTAALLITGLYASWLQVAAWAAFDTRYGWAVIAKVALYLALIIVAAVNLLHVTRRLGTPRGASMLALTVGAEVAIVCAALLAAGVLTSSEPAREAAGRGAKTATAASGPITARIAVSPGSIGANRIELRVDDRGRALAGDAASVTLRVRFVDADLGANEVALRRDPSGAFVADPVVLSLEGSWQFEVGVSSPGSFDAEVSARVAIAAAGVAGVPLPAQTTALLAAGWQVVLLALVVLVVSEAYWKGTRTARLANWGGTALVVAGIMMVYGVGHLHQGAPPAVGGRLNPVPGTAESIAAGAATYQARCVSCHGPGGLGDGPEAAALKPPPAQLPLHVPLHGDGDIFAFIEGGFPGTAMPAFRGALTDEQMWQLVNYLRTLKAPAR